MKHSLPSMASKHW